MPKGHQSCGSQSHWSLPLLLLEQGWVDLAQHLCWSIHISTHTFPKQTHFMEGYVWRSTVICINISRKNQHCNTGKHMLLTSAVSCCFLQKSSQVGFCLVFWGCFLLNKRKGRIWPAPNWVVLERVIYFTVVEKIKELVFYCSFIETIVFKACP